MASAVELKLIELAAAMKPVRVTVLHSFRKIPIVDEDIVRGVEIELPLWLAKVLEERGIVEIREGKLKTGDISQLKFLQTQQRSSLVKLDDFFYPRAIEFVKELEAKARSAGDIVALSIVERVKQDLHDLVKLRLGRILMAVQLGQVSPIERGLNIEERVLVNLLNSLVSSWLRAFSAIV